MFEDVDLLNETFPAAGQGVAMLYAPCGACGNLFTSNPDLVPSMRTPAGRQIVFCRSCVEAANPLRAEKGLPLIPVYPNTYF